MIGLEAAINVLYSTRTSVTKSRTAAAKSVTGPSPVAWQKSHLSSLQMTSNWGEKPMHWREGLPSKGTWVGWRKVGKALCNSAWRKALSPGSQSLRQQYRLDKACLGSSSAEKASGLAATKGSSIHPYSSRGTTRRWRKGMVLP